MSRILLQYTIRKFEFVLIAFQNNRILSYLKKNKLEFHNIIDIGGHHGELYNSLKKNKINFERYHIFEPFKDSFLIIEKLIDEKLIKYNIGLSDKEGSADLLLSNWETSNTLNKNIDMSSKRNKFKQFLYKDDQYKLKETIEINTLDNLFLNKEVNEILLKIDVEGHEVEVLEGGSELLKSNRVKFILIEVQDENNQIKDKLIGFGYKEIKIFKFPILNIKDSLFLKA